MRKDQKPSLPPDRARSLGLALIGLDVAVYLGLFQLRVLDSVWDPIFGERSSNRVLHSPLSRRFPVPDSILGALGYATEAITVCVGGPRRDETAPWAALGYGAMALFMGAASAALTGYQLFGLRSRCALCLLSASISVALTVPAVRESRAAFRAVGRRRDRGETWRSALRLPAARFGTRVAGSR